MDSMQTAAPQPAPSSPAQWRAYHIATCARDPLYWIAHHGWIRDERDGGVHGPGLQLWQGQADFLRAVVAGTWLVILKSRQVGVSWLLSNLDCWELLFNPYVRLPIVAQDDDASRMHLARGQWIYERQPPYLATRQPIPRFMNTQRFGVGTANDISYIETFTSSSKAIRGVSGKRTRAEELAHWDAPEDAWAAIVAAANDGGGQIVAVSTANGEGNLFHRLCVGAGW